MALLGDFGRDFPLCFQCLGDQNPYSTEQGFLSGVTGNYQARTGKSGRALNERKSQATKRHPASR
jgi:hypothetical protein